MVHINKQILLDEIRWLLEAINEQYNVIVEYDKKVPQIEFDIIMENIRKLYQDLHLFQRVDDPFDLPGKKTREPVRKSNDDKRQETVEKIKVPVIENKAQDTS